jgi:hypothetical protein
MVMLRSLCLEQAQRGAGEQAKKSRPASPITIEESVKIPSPALLRSCSSARFYRFSILNESRNIIRSIFSSSRRGSAVPSSIAFKDRSPSSVLSTVAKG